MRTQLDHAVRLLTLVGVDPEVARKWLSVPGSFDPSIRADQREREYAREQAAAQDGEDEEDPPPTMYEAGENGAPGRLLLFGVIVDDAWAEWLRWWGIRAMSGADVKAGLQAAKEDGATALELRINSPGGMVFVAQECQLALAEFKTRSGGTIPLATIEAICASAATMFALTAARIEIAPLAGWLVHFPLVSIHGNAADLRAMAEDLDRVGNVLVDQYVKRRGLAEDAVRVQMERDAFLYGAEAVEAGWVDAVIPTVDAALEDATETDGDPAGGEDGEEPEDPDAAAAEPRVAQADDPPPADPEPDAGDPADILTTPLPAHLI